MKRLQFYMLVFLYCTGAAFGQDVPFPLENAVWKEEHLTFIGPLTKHFALCGDTTLDGNSYKQVVELQVNGDSVIDKTYLGGLRAGGQVVRFVPAGLQNEFLLYDFSLQPGAVIGLAAYYFSNTVSRTVDSVKMETIAGKLRKVIYFQTNNPAPEFWMEGIGSSYGLLNRASDPGGDVGFSLLCFRHGGEYLNLTAIECFLPEATGCEITNGTDETGKPGLAFSLFPNPASEEIKVVLKNGGPAFPWQVKIFDANGRLVKTTGPETFSQISIPAGSLAPGLYFAATVKAETGEELWRGKVAVQR